MAFGGLKGTLVGGNNSIPNPLPATGSVAIAVGDLIVAVVAQQTALTVTACGDNLHGASTYSAQNAGTLATISGRMFYKLVTVAGTLTTVNAVTTSSTNDCSIAVAVFEGPFKTSPLDATPANLSADTTTPYSCPASGVLGQADELVVGWMAAASTAAHTAGGGFTKQVEQLQSANAAAKISSLVVAATTTQTPTWTGTAPSADVLGTASFRKDVGAARGTASGAGAASATSQWAISGVGSAAGAGVVTGMAAPTMRAVVSWLELEGVPVSAGASIASASGAGAAAAVGAWTNSGVGTAVGGGIASGVGGTIFSATGTAAGVGVAAGASSTAGAGSAVGVGAATGVGAWIVTGVGSAIGSGVASGVGSGAAPVLSKQYVIATPNGGVLVQDSGDREFAVYGAQVSETAGVSVVTGTALASASGQGSASAIGAWLFGGVGTATGAGVAAAVSETAVVVSGTGTAAGGGVAVGVGAATVTAVATAVGVGSALGTTLALFSSIASASGVGIASATGAQTNSGIASASGQGNAAANSRTLFSGTGVAGGVGLAAATASAIVTGTGSASGFGAAFAFGDVVEGGGGPALPPRNIPFIATMGALTAR
jgi:hypothetical protein